MAEHVETAYDRIARDVEGQTRGQREQSVTIRLRQVNNWVKSTLIHRFCPVPYASVLDIACGKGGDIPKWEPKKPALYVMADLSLESLKVAYQRHHRRMSPCRAFWLVGDIFGCNLEEFIPRDVMFDMVSCQFAFHYCFRDESHARRAIENMCVRAKPGAHIVMTVPNACRMVKLFQESETNRVSNDIFYMERKFDLDNIPPFGAEYVFYLDGSVEHCSEFLVHPAVVSSLFREYGCSLVESMEFHKYYHQCLESYPEMKMLFLDLLKKTQGGTANADMTQNEWDVISLYSFYVFKKDGVSSPSDRRQYSDVMNGNEFVVTNVDDGQRTTVRVERNQQRRR